MLQHVIQRYLDSEHSLKRSSGVCYFIEMSQAVLPIDTTIRRRATAAWIQSTAVPSSHNKTFPVAHPSLDAHGAYVDGQANENMLAGEYGKNREQYAEFVRDYAEEYWK